MGPVTFPAYLQTSAEARSRALAFDDTVVDNDAARAASWTRFYQLEAALEGTVLDCLYGGGDAAAAIDDFASAVRSWLTDHVERYGAWYPGAEDVRENVSADVEHRVALIIAPHVEQRGAADEDLSEADEVVAHDEPVCIPTYPLIMKG
jgi:hypothetical protein